jgi:outer membrane immunogenic protein
MTRHAFNAAAAGLLTLALTGSAFASDLPPPRAPSYRPAIFSPQSFTWSGFYVGVNAGYGWGTTNWADGLGGPPANFRTTGAVAGLTLGYNIQTGSFVWGVEADIDWSGIKGTETTVCGTPGCTTKLTWVATDRLRVGYAFDHWLPYLTGGFAFAGMTNSGANASESVNKAGWTLGAGVEYAFMGAWSAKLDYLYVKFNNTTCTTCFTGDPQDISYKAQLVRAGVNYRF